MDKKIIRIELLVVLLAVVISINSQFLGFVNKYVIADDYRQQIYWMEQFRDKGLFQNDLLTEYAKSCQPWGLIFIYYICCIFVDPILVSKILPVLLFAISSLYIFKLVKYIKNTYVGFLAALIFMTTPLYLDQMVGGLARGFGYPLVVIFLYYLIKKEYVKSSFALILQSLFYPTVFFLSVVTYSLTFINFRDKKIFLDISLSKVKFFIFAVSGGLFILFSRWVLIHDPNFGTLFVREQMVGYPEFYAIGRSPMLPIQPLLKEIFENMKYGAFIFNALFFKTGLCLIFLLFLIKETFEKRLFLPSVILFLFLSGILMYKLADLFLLKLYLPNRYIRFSVPLVSSIVFSVSIGQLIEKAKNLKVKSIIKILVIILIALNINVKNKSFCLTNFSKDKELCGYLSSLPKDVMIAAHPVLADNIPTFSKRKVFINYELSHTLFDKYWKVIKNRTFDFFDAYYADDPSKIYNFCKEREIDYLVVDRRHFVEKFIREGWVYFEPFNSFIKTITKNKRNFVLANIPDKDKLFIKDSVFVIHRNVLIR